MTLRNRFIGANYKWILASTSFLSGILNGFELKLPNWGL